MGLSTVTLSCTGTSSPKLVKSPIRKLSATGTVSVLLLKLPQKVLGATLVSSPVISLMSFGIDAFDILEGKRKWIVNGVDRFQLGTKKRFTFLVRGRPSG